MRRRSPPGRRSSRPEPRWPPGSRRAAPRTSIPCARFAPIRDYSLVMAKRYWLMKCEPAAYTIDDLARDGVTSWEGVRNYQARNMMRDEMQVGDDVLFYASNAEPSGVTGLARIAKAGYPDHTSWKKGHKYYDETSSKDTPTWYMVDI